MRRCEANVNVYNQETVCVGISVTSFGSCRIK
jgi:hypothetical protein